MFRKIFISFKFWVFFTTKLAFIGILIAGTAGLSPGSCVAISVITKYFDYIKSKFPLKGILRAVRKLLKYPHGTAISGLSIEVLLIFYLELENDAKSNAILLAFSANTLCASLLSLRCNFNILALFFRQFL